MSGFRSARALRNCPYEVLGVAQDAGSQAIKDAYRVLAKKFHPDANPDCEEAKEQFLRVQALRKILSTPTPVPNPQLHQPLQPHGRRRTI